MFRALLLVLLISLLPGPGLGAEGWGATLQSGRSITVDPRTNRVTVQTEAGEAQLWDGVHLLEDGTSITVRSGVMVPNAELQEFKHQQRYPSQAFVSEGPAPCRELIERTCGVDDACADSPACGPARQLLELYREEQGGISPERAFGQGYLPADVQCRQALDDRDFFVPCGGEQRGQASSACRRLTARVCGAEGQCAEREACGPARQLLETETRERRRALDPGAPTPATGQCRRALDDDRFFTPCDG